MAPRRRIAFERPCLRWTTSLQKCSWPVSSLSRVDAPGRGRCGRRSPCSAPSTPTTWPALCAASPWHRVLWAGRRQRRPGAVDVCAARHAWPPMRSRRLWPSEELRPQGFSLTAWPSESVSDALYAVLVLAVVAPLPGLVADWALALPPLSSASSTAPLARPVLPWGAVPSEDRAVSAASREALALEAMSEITYELADVSNEEGI